jgi:hypothetical protein
VFKQERNGKGRIERHVKAGVDYVRQVHIDTFVRSNVQFQASTSSQLTFTLLYVISKNVR